MSITTPDLRVTSRLLLSALLVASAAVGCGSELTCPEGQSCCSTDSQCGGHMPRCDSATHSCVECLQDQDNCPSGKLCIPAGSGWKCSSDCVSNHDCERLGAAFKCCGGTCANTTSDIRNCGSCGMACATPPHGMPVCATPFCGLGSCDSGYDNCDQNPDNGCETATDTDARNCGACGNRCDLPNATSTCMAGKCAVRTCVGDNHDCDAVASNGCESAPASDPLNCGGCGNMCPALTNGSAACRQGQCGLGMCNAGFADCNVNAADGCEVSLADDTRNCGACGRPCVVAHAVAACKDRMCQIGSCSGQYADCDRQAGNGCEIDLSGDPGNCGACGSACMKVAHGSPGCAAGVCGIGACDPGFGDCDKMAANGCETDLSSLANCGACNVNCPAPANASAACNAGVCGVGVCTAPFADCDRQGGNGCEVDTSSDLAHCGGCGKACVIANASAACTNGRCAFAMCNLGFQDCDGQLLNGCEIRTDNDSKNCGQCGNACLNGVLCAGGKCQSAGPNCQAIKMAAPNSPDGMYNIDPDGNGPLPPFSAWCDMTTDGGGWTLWASVLKDSPSSMAAIMPNSQAYMDTTRYAALSAVSKTFRARGQSTGNTYFLTKGEATAGNCQNLSTPVPENVDLIAMPRGYTTVYGHRENAGCDLIGSDYAFLAAGNNGHMYVQGGNYGFGGVFGPPFWHKGSLNGITDFADETVEARVELYLQ